MPFHGFQPTASKNIITNDIIVKAGTHLLAFGVEKIPFLSNIIFWNSGYVQRMKGKTFCLIFFLEKWVCEDLFERNSFPPPSWDQCAGNSFSSPFFKRLRSFQSTSSRVWAPGSESTMKSLVLTDRTFVHWYFCPPGHFFTVHVKFPPMSFFYWPCHFLWQCHFLPTCRGCAADDFLSLCLKTAQFVGLEGKILRKMFSPVNYCCLPSLPSSSLLPLPDSWIK